MDEELVEKAARAIYDIEPAVALLPGSAGYAIPWEQIPGDQEPYRVIARAALASIPTVEPIDGLCSDCPPDGYPTDKTRCLPCPRRTGGAVDMREAAAKVAESYARYGYKPTTAKAIAAAIRALPVPTSDTVRDALELGVEYIADAANNVPHGADQMLFQIKRDLAKVEAALKVVGGGDE